MSATTTTYADALKEYYTKARLANLFYGDAPLLANLKKSPKFPGSKLIVPTRYGIAQGVSATFATAKALSASTSSLIERFELTRVKKYVFATIENELLKASKGDEGSFVEALTEEIDSALLCGKRRLAWDAYRGGWGKVGVIGSVSGSDITLATTEDVVGFEKGMEIVFSSAESTATLRSATTLQVTAVNRATGVITCSAGITSITNTTTGDYIFYAGDRQNSATPSRLCLSGTEAWIPQSAPSTATFHAVDRTLDITRLAGQRIDGRGAPVHEALIEARVQIGREGGKPTHVFLNHTYWAKLEKELGTKVRYSNDVAKNGANIGFNAIELVGPAGGIKVIADAYCPADTAFMLDMESWKMHFLDDMFSNVGDGGGDGLEILRDADADQFESRWAFYGNLGCDAPGHNANVRLA
jgi:hypothetical protein